MRIALIWTLLTATASAQASLTIVAPAAPGGGWDQTARAMQRVFSSVEPAASVQVENVAGAAGTIGLARFVTTERGNPDALLITGLVMMTGITTNRAPVRLTDTTPIARLTGEYEVIVVPARSEIRTLRDLTTTLINNPEALTWGGGSAGGTDDLLVRLFAQAVGVSPARINYIAFPGGGAAVAALIGGQVMVGVSGYGEFAGQIEAGTLRALAISAPQRIDGINVPTLREQGVDVLLSNWRGIVAPPGLSDTQRDALTARIERLATSPAWRQTLERSGWTDMLLTGAAFREFLVLEQQRVDDVVRRLSSDATTETSSNLPTSPLQGGVITPATGPAIALSLLALVAVVSVFTSKTQLTRERHEGRAMVLIIALLTHAIVFPVIGFVPASTALYVLTASLFGSRHWLRDAGIGVSTAALLYVAFTFGLGLTLPQDPIARWLIE